MVKDYGGISIEEIETSYLKDLILRILDDELIKDKDKVIKNLCAASIKIHGLSISDLTGEFKKYRTKNLCHLAVQTNGLALSFLSQEERTNSLCLQALKKNIEALKYLSTEEQVNLALDSECSKAFLLQIGNFSRPNLRLLESSSIIEILNRASEVVYWENFYAIINTLPATILPQITPIICKAITNCLKTEAMQATSPSDRSVENIISCLPPEVINKDICLAAINHNWKEIKSIPENLLDLDLLMAAVQINGMALQFVPPKLLAEITKDSEGLDLFIEAVSNNAMALQYVPDNLKEQVIEKISVPSILSNNYLARQFFPSAAHYSRAIKEYLSTISIVVITEDDAFNNNAEIKDSFAVYSTHPSRIGKLVHTEAKDSRALLEDLRTIPNHPQNLSLVCMGHHVRGAGLAQLSSIEIAQYLSQYKNISRLILFGCNTVKAPLVTEETEILEQLQARITTETQEDLERGCLFATLSQRESTSQQPLLRHSFPKNHPNALIYILVKSGNEYSLAFIDRKQGIENILIKNLNCVQIKWLETWLNKGKQFSFKENLTFIANAKKTLDRIGLENIHSFMLLTKADYKEVKKYFPLFNNFKVLKKEAKYSILSQIISVLEDCYIDKVETFPPNIESANFYGNAKYFFSSDSLLYINKLRGEYTVISLSQEQKIFLENQLNPTLARKLTNAELLEINKHTKHLHQSLDREVELKGFTKSLYVDTQGKRFYVSDDYLYPSVYMQPKITSSSTDPSIIPYDTYKTFSLFCPVKENSEAKRDSQAKSITVILNRPN